MKNKIIVFMLVFCLTSVMFLSTDRTVKATETEITLEDWEDYNEGVHSGTGDYISWESQLGDSTFTTYSSHEFSDMVLKIESQTSSKNTYFNLTQDFDYISSVSLVSDFDMAQVSGYPYYDTYLRFYNDDVEVLKFQFVHTHSTSYMCDMRYYDANNDACEYANDIDDYDEAKVIVKISHISGNLMNYSLYYANNETFIKSHEDSCRISDDWTTFDRIVLTTDNTQSTGHFRWYLDDIIITTDDPIEDDEEEEGGGESGDYLCFGDIDCYEYMASYSVTGYQYLEMQRNQRMTGTIKEVYIPILNYNLNNNMYYFDDHNLNDFECYINGNDLGYPDSYIEDYCTANNGNLHITLLKWTGRSIEIDNEKPLLEVMYSGGSVYEFAVGIMRANYGYDFDQDGDQDVKYHNTGSQYGDGTYNGELLYNSAWGTDDIEFMYKICYLLPDSGSGGSDSYDDQMFIKDDSIGLHDVQQIDYVANLSQGATYFRIYNVSGSVVVNETCELHGTFFYNPVRDGMTTNDIGTYKCSLWRTGGNVSYDTFEVTDDTGGIEGGGYQIYMDQTVFTPVGFTNARLYYKYNATASGNNGYIRIADNDGTEVYGTSVDTTDWLEHYLSGLPLLDSGEYYIAKLYTNVGGTLFLRDSFGFSIQSATGVSATITVDKTTVDLKESFTISGFHNLIGHNVYIKIEPVGHKEYVSYDPVFEYTYTPTTYGDLYISLWRDNESLTDTIKVTVIKPAGGGGEGGILPELDSFIGAIVGLILTIVMTMVPLILSAAINTQTKITVNIPPVVYAITGAMGVVVSTVFGWFPSWVIFFIVAVGIIILMVMYYQNSGGGSA